MKNFLKQNWYWIGIVIVLFSMLFSQCSNEKIHDSNIDALNSKITTYKLKNGQLVSTVKSLTYSKSELKELVLAKDKKLKQLSDKFVKPKVVIQTVIETKIDSIMIPYDVPVPYKFTREGSIVNIDYSFKYKSNELGVSINDFELSKDTLNAVLGVKRKWLLGKETSTLDITHSNKNVQETSVLVIEVKEKNKFYETNLFKFGAGFVLGRLSNKL